MLPEVRPRLSQVKNYPAILEAAWRDHLRPRAADAPTVISVFAGGGGSSLGYSMAGFRELLAVEWDRYAVATFRQNFPGVAVYDQDIARLSVDDVCQRTGLRPGDLDILDGSPPCQGFSLVNTGGYQGKTRQRSTHFSDPRNQLFREYARLLQGLRPKAFVMENVGGMVKGGMRLIFVEIVRTLRATGYRIAVQLMNTKYFEVPQSRDRVIFIGLREDLHRYPMHPIAHTIPISLNDALVNLSDLKQLDRRPPGKTTLRTTQYWRETRRGYGHAKRFSIYRAHWARPVNTIMRTTGYAGIFHPDEPRRLSIGELQRCASFPDAFTFPGSFNQAIGVIGNSVPPLFMRALARHVCGQLEVPREATG